MFEKLSGVISNFSYRITLFLIMVSDRVDCVNSFRRIYAKNKNRDPEDPGKLCNRSKLFCLLMLCFIMLFLPMMELVDCLNVFMH